MTAAELAARVKALAEGQTDDEAAHAEEDAIRNDVLWAIAEGAEFPQTLARIALETGEISFNRWCA